MDEVDDRRDLLHENNKKALASVIITGMALTLAPVNSLANSGVTPARLFGSDRIGTAVAVADAGWTTADTGRWICK